MDEIESEVRSWVDESTANKSKAVPAEGGQGEPGGFQAMSIAVSYLAAIQSLGRIG